MRKIALILMLSLTMMVMVACERTSSSTNRSTSSMTSSLSSTQQIRDDAALNAERLTLKQTAALVLYYRDAHMPGANDYDYSADMENNNQGATVKIYDKGAVPWGEGSSAKTYPKGAKVLYMIKLTSKSDEDGDRLNSTYYTIVGNKVYYANSSNGIRKIGVTLAEMVTYAKTHGEVNRVLKVAKNTKIIDMRGKVTITDKDGLTTQQLGTLVALLKNPDWFKAGVQNGEMYYGTHYGYGEVADYQYVTTQGDLTSYIWFKRKGNDVTIKMIGSTENQNVTGAPMTTTHTTVTNLINNYYTSEDQQDEVNAYADQLKVEP
ncbi:Lreu_0056 family protein [Limosilactobacillus reuteri]|uniref:Lreu-0056-like domain-containing protein n=3 Tax=Limosilactobacillus reuteri TaxID=1598 RepID=Q4JLH8_LIMRT|nr:hypothetical protein [Limosilactobacillus reuteri]AAY86872.1 unknown extracellular protein lr1331 [Limosilactobacillus reuteri]AEI57208.1 hypothetical protein HMPREF0538_20997 [Limosilactobacillus reuteri SD2112]EEI64794.1 hypothetical protein HMPREF0534_1880 [Limosilactobacillus reuteri CF48-3A]MBU5983510.1 hypothetical protein [Limosilactobacillus reuteri]MCC4451569.1 hypothetical protein [Limosilactobacillus reuteri]